MTRSYAEVIGDPIAQSKSPSIHGFWLEKLGIEAEYRATHVSSEGLSDYLAGRREDPDWRGCNVTMPHKQAILPMLDELSDAAARIGAVNTIQRANDGRLIGHNTDAAGFMEPLKREIAGQHFYRMARVIGTGGAARAIVWALAEHGFTIVLASRNPDKAAAILSELAPGAESFTPPLDHFATPIDFAFDDREGCLDLVVNASPLGMCGQPLLEFDWSHAPSGAIAYDIVTDPVRTPFLEAAQSRGHPTIDGLSMLIGQAAAAFLLFFSVEAPREHDAELRERLTQ